MNVDIRPAGAGDSEALARIYNHYIRDSIITFEEVEVPPAEMGERVAAIGRLSFPWIVAGSEGTIVGYAYAGKWRERSAYRFAVESTVYLDPAYTGRGIGTQLYRELLTRLRSTSVHTVLGGIALPNSASVALHEKLGFTKVAHLEDVGFKLGRWIDVAYWQLVL
ncbi:MAG TPA: GNAT family N-acetyltransferase [Gammaproteobacteria bacterium]|nr:GNAT family N-acetyltransferase [Gammaproteobacteria bacterium]